VQAAVQQKRSLRKIENFSLMLWRDTVENFEGLLNVKTITMALVKKFCVVFINIGYYTQVLQ